MYDVLFAWSRVRRTERIVRQTWCLRSRRSMSTRWPRRLTSAYARTERRWPLAIRSVTIGGQALGTLGSVSTADSFGFVAQQIGSFKINGFAVPLAAGAANDLTGLLIGITGDLHVLEVGL